MSRMKLALGLFAGLGVVVWFTLQDVPLGVGSYRIGLRTATLVILGLFAFRTVMHGYRLKLEAAQSESEKMEAVRRE